MLTVYTLEQAEQWDQIVRTFAQYDVYYLSGYVKAFQIHGDGEPLLFYYEKDDTRAINVVMKRDVSADKHFYGQLEANTYFDLSTPYGYGGWLLEGTDAAGVYATYEKWCVEHGIISEFVRFHPVLKNHSPWENLYQVIPLGEIVTLDLSSSEVIWENIISKNRNMIRKAQKNNIQIHIGRNSALFEAFLSIYNATMDKDKAERYYYFNKDFYDSILHDLPENAQIFYAELEGEIISVSIMLYANGKMTYHLSGSRREYANLAATNLLLYEAAMWGCENGCQTFLLGGGVGSGEDGVFKFKKSFYRGDDLERFHIGKKIFDQEKYDLLVSKRDDLPESGFFPRYRA